VIPRLRAWWFAPAPAERLAAARLLIGGYALWYLWGRFGELRAVASLPAAQWRPIGVARWLDGPLPVTAFTALVIATLALTAAFVVGVRYRIAAPLAALGLLVVTTYRNSWGMVFHTENLLVLHVIALALAPAADAWSIDARRRTTVDPPPERYGWALRLLVALTAASYLLAGIAKLRIAGLDWLDGDQLRNQIAVDNLRKALLGDSVAPLATELLAHPGVLTGFCVLTLVLELGAPVALINGWPARLWALAIWGFHLGVVLAMNIWFLYPLSFVAFAPIFRVERPFGWLIGQAAARVRRLRPR
jgi:Vitamin K-dependent gamma-carboxylase